MKNFFVLIYIILSTCKIFAQYPITKYSPKLPQLNKNIIDILDTMIGKTIYRGECWDVAKLVLNQTNASWDKKFNFGKSLNYKLDTILPGDIIQFSNVTIKIPDNITWIFEQHTAIVYQVISPQKYIIAHQNVNGNRRLQTDTIQISYIVNGKIAFFRPYK